MDYCDEMRVLRPVNLRLGNLRQHVVTDIRTMNGDVVVRFESADPLEGFCLVLEGVVDHEDRGAVGMALTAGVVWKPLGEFGSSAAKAAGLDPAELIECRLDYEDNETLVCRFRAVAANARLA
jgi:hypothetical protein